jgi:Fe-S-cluster containining protein
MLPRYFQCKQCGNCCLNLSDAFQTSVTDEDIRRWEEKGRYDILEWVSAIVLGDGQFVYDIWINPRTGEDVARCPWLRKLPNQNKYICRIHDVKPEHCRKYPKSRKHAEETGCVGFEDW